MPDKSKEWIPLVSLIIVIVGSIYLPYVSEGVRVLLIIGVSFFGILFLAYLIINIFKKQLRSAIFQVTKSAIIDAILKTSVK